MFDHRGTNDLLLSWVRRRAFHAYSTQLEFSFGRRQPAGNSRISLARNIYGPRKSLENRLDDVVWFIAIKQFQVEVAAGRIGESLKEFAGQSKPEYA